MYDFLDSRLVGLLFWYTENGGLSDVGKLFTGRKGGLVVATESGERILRGGEISVRFFG